MTKAHRADWSKSAKSYVENLIRALGAANVAVLGISGWMGRADLGPTGLWPSRCRPFRRQGRRAFYRRRCAVCLDSGYVPNHARTSLRLAQVGQRLGGRPRVRALSQECMHSVQMSGSNAGGAEVTVAVLCWCVGPFVVAVRDLPANSAHNPAPRPSSARLCHKAVTTRCE